MRALAFVFLLIAASIVCPAAAGNNAGAACRAYFGRACGEAMGRWLPRIPNVRGADVGAESTKVDDEIVDPGGRGELRFLKQRGVYRGTFFVYGTAGPPKGHVVYDPTHRIAFYDEGCCSWHHVVVASDAPSPPESIAMRSLSGLRTRHGVRLGAGRSVVSSVYGPAEPRPVSGIPNATTLSYRRVEKNQPGLECTATTTFLFARDRLTAMDFRDEC